jgi:hypothetical protein
MSNRFTRAASIISIATLSLVVVNAPEARATAILTPIHSMIEALEPQSVPAMVVSAEFLSAHSDKAFDFTGYEKSIYRGIHYRANQESFRECVMQRESHFNYRAKNRSSSASGAFQFLDNNWRDGLVWMMLKESKRTGDGLDTKVRRLFDRPIKHWSRYWQDRAFFTAMNINGDWAGKHHWNATVPGTSC